MGLKSIGGFEWVIILAIVLLIFGVGRVSKIGKELGTAVSEFRNGLNQGKKDQEEDVAEADGANS